MVAGSPKSGNTSRVETRAKSLASRRRYANLLREITVTQYKIKDQSTFFGFLWSFLHPLLLLGILYGLFKGRAGSGIEHYGLYVLIGIVHFNHFSNSTSAGMTVLYTMRHLTANAILPKEVLVIGSVLGRTPEFVSSLAICAAIAVATGVRPGWLVLLLPVVVLLQLLLVLWVSLILAALYLFVRDTAYVYQVFLRVLFIATPTFYAATFVGSTSARLVVLLNPLAQLIDYSRAFTIGGTSVSLLLLGAAIGANALLLIGALALFRRLEPLFAEYV